MKNLAYWTTRNSVYLSPTICNSIKCDNYAHLKEKEGDLFSLGCTLFMILFRKYPFGSNHPTLNQKLKVCEDIAISGVLYFNQFKPSFEIND